MSDLCERDFHGWAAEQGALLRSGKLAAADIAHIAEEIESVGRSEKRELTNRLAVVLAQLRKWRFQPERRGKSWELTIRELRRQVARVLGDNPSLRPLLDEILRDAYGDAVLIAERETDLPGDGFPAESAWTFDEAMQRGSEDRWRSGRSRPARFRLPMFRTFVTAAWMLALPSQRVADRP